MSHANGCQRRNGRGRSGVMKEVIKRILAKIKRQVKISKCYNEMEGKNIAVFGMCSGKWHEIGFSYSFPYKQCSICPHFRNVRSDS